MLAILRDALYGDRTLVSAPTYRGNRDPVRSRGRWQVVVGGDGGEDAGRPALCAVDLNDPEPRLLLAAGLEGKSEPAGAGTGAERDTWFRRRCVIQPG